MDGLVRRVDVVPFINTGTKEQPKWTQIKKSTSFVLDMNPQTKTYDFISEEIPQEVIEGYKPNLAQSLTMFKGEPDYEVIFDMFYNRATDEAAHKDVLISFYKEKGSYTPHGETESILCYRAWIVDSLVKIKQMDTSNQCIEFDLSFNKIKNGAVTLNDTEKPTFIEGIFEKEVFIATKQ